MKTDDKSTESKVVVGGKNRRRLSMPNGLRKHLSLIVVAAVVVLALGGFGGVKWYKHYQASQAEKKYQTTLTHLTSLNQQGKSKEVITVAEKYLGSKPQPKYQLRPKYFLALAYMGTNQTDKAKPLLEQQIADPSLALADKPAVLSALITIAKAQDDKVAGEKYLSAMVDYLKERAALPENQKHKSYYTFEIQRYQAILNSLRKLKQ
jgi:hypothetical protein